MFQANQKYSEDSDHYYPYSQGKKKCSMFQVNQAKKKKMCVCEKTHENNFSQIYCERKQQKLIGTKEHRNMSRLWVKMIMITMEQHRLSYEQMELNNIM